MKDKEPTEDHPCKKPGEARVTGVVDTDPPPTHDHNSLASDHLSPLSPLFPFVAFLVSR